MILIRITMIFILDTFYQPIKKRPENMILIKITMTFILDTFYQPMSKRIYYLPFVIRDNLCDTETVQTVTYKRC